MSATADPSIRPAAIEVAAAQLDMGSWKRMITDLVRLPTYQ
jgi:hypothetical protein